MGQLSKGTTYTGAAPGNVVNFTNLNALVDSATALAGLILDQNAKSTPTIGADKVLVADSTHDNPFPPVQVSLDNLLPDTTRLGGKKFGTSTATGSPATNYNVTLSPAPTSYTSGMTILFKAGTACASAPTVTVVGLTAVNIVNGNGAALAAGNIPAAAIVQLVYDSGSNNFQMVALWNDAARISTALYGPESGTSSAYVVTLNPAPSALPAGMRVTFKAGHTSVQSSGHTTLNVNGLGPANILTTGGVDIPSGIITSGQVLECIYDGTSWWMIGATPATTTLSVTTAIPAAGTVTSFTHGLGSVPTFVRTVLKCTSADGGYAVGAEIPIEQTYTAAGNNFPFLISSANSTTVDITMLSGTSTPVIYNRSSGATYAYNLGDWILKIYYRL